MSQLNQHIESAIDQCLENKIPRDLVTHVAGSISIEELAPIVSYLKNVSDPYEFFQKRKYSGKKSPDGFFLFVDMLSAFIISIGPDAEEFVRKQITPTSHFLEWALKYATEERFSADIRSRFLSGNPAAINFEHSVGSHPSPEFEAVAKPLAVFKSKNTWELSGETDVKAKLESQTSKIRVTVSNGYGPINNLKVFYQLTSVNSPILTLSDRNDGHWQELQNIEEIIYRADQYFSIEAYSQSDAFDEVLWWKTFEAELVDFDENKRIQIMIIDPKEFDEAGEEQGVYTSTVINDWIIKANT